ncbi:MAG: PDZ domain-containing protein [Thermoanaerobaculia bacterium]
MRSIRSLFIGFLALVMATALFAQDDLTRLLRYPDIHGDTIAFVYAGDIWVVGADGGTARRLTSHPGLELFPKFSPDGKSIAFVGDYNGTRQVYVISVDGGQPRQLTYYNDVGPMPPRGGVDNRVVGWTPDGKSVLFLAHRLPFGERMATFYTVPATGGMETPLEIPEAGGGVMSPDGTKIVYTPIEREFRTWKHYRGGRAQDVWIYDLKNHSSKQITNWVGTDNQPVWLADGTIEFTSDREHTLNLYSYSPATGATTKATHHDDWDVLWPSSDGRRVVYEAGGYVWRFDPSTGEDVRVPIRVYGDLPGTVPYFKNVKDEVHSFSISPSGARALFDARGDVFTVPAKEGEIRNLTATPGIRELDASWSPDGRLIAYLSDRTGEYEIYVRNADGSGAERQVTSNGHVWKTAPLWSPDSRYLAFADKNATLHYVDSGNGKIVDVDKGKYADIDQYQWSPDSKWIAYTDVGPTRLSTIRVYSLKDAKSYALTDGRTDDYSPVFDPKGRYLYFLSNRDFNLTFSGYEFNYLYTKPTRVYVGLLAADGPALLLPTNDEEKPASDTSAESGKKDEKKKDAKTSSTPDVKIDVAGFESRVRAIPSESDQYRALAANDKGVFFIKGEGAAAELKFYDLEGKKSETVLSGIQAWDLAAGGEKLIYSTGDDYGIVDAKPGQKSGDHLDLAHLEMKIVPRAEWSEEFVDAWRTFRDWFYDPNMHGIDWAAMRKKYEPLVAFVAHRSDLDYILGELGGELVSGHVYIQTSDDWQIPRKDGALLGANVDADPSGSGYFRITKIFPGENWSPEYRSPLTEPGVKVKEGDLILAVDGVSTKGVENFYSLLENKANRLVTLRVGSTPDPATGHDEIIRPIKYEGHLRYLAWVTSRQKLVDELSGGRIGYIHIPDTAVEGNRELFKHFFPQANKDALIIDDRYNGGGFIPDRMIELLDRPLLNYWVVRGVEPIRTPGFANVGPKAVLINGYSSSGGDAFPYYFKKLKLGKVIGTRTWGGLIGLSGNADLMDGGTVLVPTFRILDTEGAWTVEDHGVDPDIEVVDRPELVVAGKDPSLEKAVEVLMKELEANPPKKLVVPPPPDMSKQ